MKKAVLVLALSTLSIVSFGQFKIKQPISNEPETDLQREVLWGVMTENLLGATPVYDLQIKCRVFKPNGKVLYERIVPYSTSDAKRYKLTSPTTWVKIDNTSENWNDTTYVPEFRFFYRLMNKTKKTVTDEDLKKAIMNNLDVIDKLFDK